VVTDFGVHPFWISPGTDIYIAASSYTKTQLLREGVREGQIKEFGIPIEEKFSRTYDRTELCRTFGFKPRSFTVLISTGSFGIGPIERIVASLCLEAQLLVVCANNKRLYARLKARNYPQVRVFGFIDNIEELMAISDVIIAKPGGLTIAESLAMGLFPFFVIAIPGQEAENAKALSSFGIGLYSKDTSLIIDSVLRLKYHPDACRRARELTQRLKRPFSTKELCSVIRESSIRPSH
jgi:processive 1,2-diacylglycerol beta-glucosyltransferase